jgi:hypothetical protein
MATRTLGDPFGLEHAWKAQPNGDNDQDGSSNIEEYRRGTDPGNAQSIPPSLQLGPSIGSAPFSITLNAPGSDGLIFVVLCSLSGASPGLSLSADGFSAPFYDLVVFDDMLATGLVVGASWASGVFPGMPLAAVGLGGQITFPVRLPPILVSLGAGFRISCSGAVIDSGLLSVKATTSTLCFDVLGNPCP